MRLTGAETPSWALKPFVQCHEGKSSCCSCPFTATVSPDLCDSDIRTKLPGERGSRCDDLQNLHVSVNESKALPVVIETKNVPVG